MRKPNFENFLKVLDRKKPSRATLYEFYLNRNLEEFLAQRKLGKDADIIAGLKLTIDAYHNAGYDYVPILGSDFAFERAKHDTRTYSANSNCMVTDDLTYEKYEWKNPEDADYSRLKTLQEYLPEGMKFVVYGLDGVLENVIGIVGYENLCLMMYDNEELVKKLFHKVGERLAKYYEICLQYDSVGAVISNDDWGYNTGTMLSPEQMRKYLFPYHKKIVDIAHANNRKIILHSCGKLDMVYDEIIDYLGYDAKHSNEDTILPVKTAYEKYCDRIAILGGIDLDFIIREDEKKIVKRCENMLAMSYDKGGYALGSGNSIPDYVPIEKYLAMINCIKNN